MSLRLLKIFQSVVECGGISAAAKALYMSQPAISHAIAQLEERIHVRLFERIGKRLYLSESGKVYYQKVCQVLTMMDDLEQETLQLHQYPPIRIGSSITNALVLLPKLLGMIQSKYKGDIKVIVENAQSIKEKLCNNEIDLAFLEGALPSEEFIAYALFDYENKLFCSSDDSLCHQNIASIKELAKERWLLREKGSAIRDSFDSTMNLLDEVVQPVWESCNSQVLIEAVKAHQGISILPLQLLTQELNNHTIHLLPVKEVMICKNHLVYHKEKYLHEGMHLFLETCNTMKFNIT